MLKLAENSLSFHNETERDISIRVGAVEVILIMLWKIKLEMFTSLLLSMPLVVACKVIGIEVIFHRCELKRKQDTLNIFSLLVFFIELMTVWKRLFIILEKHFRFDLQLIVMWRKKNLLSTLLNLNLNTVYHRRESNGLQVG